MLILILLKFDYTLTFRKVIAEEAGGKEKMLKGERGNAGCVLLTAEVCWTAASKGL
jgi:hypothetical protein